MRRFLPYVMAALAVTVGLMGISGREDEVADSWAEDSLAQLIARGERLFFTETFGGNGRTCGTCHPAENNFTIDPAFIATLPPSDPLFVAETNPALAENFENPTLMRRFGLIQENLDGFNDLQNVFVMRGVPHTLALPTSMRAPADGRGPVQRTGWSGDGAPGDGSLRSFATGAVIQHFTKTLNRVPGIDFRLPTPEELDALEAFQLSLGRQQDLDLPNMVLRGQIPERGRQLFLQPAKACNFCHRNAGATANFGGGDIGNANFNTGVEDTPDQAARAAAVFPRDGGFGQAPAGYGAFGDGTFNAPPLVEAADTPPFFHNGSAATIEDVVAFYASPAFTAASGFTIALAADEIRAIAGFLRAINALENIRFATEYQERAKVATPRANAQRLAALSAHEVGDAIRVLQDAGLHPDAVRFLQQAQFFAERAAGTQLQVNRNVLLQTAITFEEQARQNIVVDPWPVPMPQPAPPPIQPSVPVPPPIVPPLPQPPVP